MYAIPLKHYKGKWPFLLSLRQAIVCPVSDKSQAYGKHVRDLLFKSGYHVDIHTSDRTVPKKGCCNGWVFNSFTLHIYCYLRDLFTSPGNYWATFFTKYPNFKYVKWFLSLLNSSS